MHMLSLKRIVVYIRSRTTILQKSLKKLIIAIKWAHQERKLDTQIIRIFRYTRYDPSYKITHGAMCGRTVARQIPFKTINGFQPLPIKY